uniref:Uncharacterized protein n=1 Tax=Cacopsylla melanoneura TaxID=428564 RepID=A0A8D9F0I9_9HEMI
MRGSILQKKFAEQNENSIQFFACACTACAFVNCRVCSYQFPDLTSGDWRWIFSSHTRIQNTHQILITASAPCLFCLIREESCFLPYPKVSRRFVQVELEDVLH